MKLRCDDGIVREFTKAIVDGDRLPDGTRANLWHRPVEAECRMCGYLFGVHSTKRLKPIFKQHVCKVRRSQ